MIRHVVLFAFRDDVDKRQRHDILERFRSLKDAIKEVKSIEDGINLSVEGLDQGLTHCFLMDFADVKARDRYLAHPAHADFVGAIVPLCKNAIVFDFEPEKT